MPIPAAVAIGGQIAASALGGILGGRKKPKAPDVRPLLNQINAGGQEQRNIIASRRENLRPINEQFGKDMAASRERFAAGQAKLGEEYVQEAGRATDSQGNQLTDILRQRRFETLPQEQQSLRESIAAGGGAGTGAALEAATQLQTSAGRDVGQGIQEITVQQMQQRQQALKDKFGLDMETADKVLGLDAGTIQALYSSGRQDLIDEADALIAESQNRQGLTLQAQQIGQNRQFASDLAAKEGRDAALQAGLGGLSNLLGQLAAKK